MNRTTCRSCTAPIVWASTSDGNAMPVDADPTPPGTVVFTGRDHIDTGIHRPEVVVLTQDDLFTDPTSRHTSHFATCPDADTWRRPLTTTGGTR